MKVTLLQSNLIWEDKDANLQSFETQIQNIKSDTDLIILPEMFTTGFSMQPERWAEKHKGFTFKKMQDWAVSKQSAVLGSLIVKEDGKYYNRAYFVFPDGTFQYYDKRHLFRMAKENEHYSSGNSRVIVEYKGWRIFPLICYDLRFPIWSRNNLDYDLLIYVANWPERRAKPWKTLLQARAIENLSYVVGVNRIGKDGNGVEHSGDSALIDFKGDVLSNIQAYKTQCQTIELNKEALNSFRSKFPAHTDADLFTII
jgi:predicted amidohydrolase